MESWSTAFRVLDLTTTLSGAYCGCLLSAGGASITRVEPPDGHPLRKWTASGSPIPEGADGALFSWLAGGQESVTADASDLDAILAWAAAADAILWSEGSVVPIATLQAAVHDVPIISITPFGLEGPWAGLAATEFTLQAMTGGPAIRGARAWPPTSVGGQFGEYIIGVFAAVATLISVRRRALTGAGGTFDLSGLEASIMTQLFNPATMETQVGGVHMKRQKAPVADVVESKDGFVGFTVIAKLQNWLDLCAMIGQPQWAEDPTLFPVQGRTERHEELNPVIAAWAKERTTAEIVELAALYRIPCVEVGHGESLPRMEHFEEADYWSKNPDQGFLQPAPPFRMHPPVPGVGELRSSPKLGPSIRTIERPSRPRAQVPEHAPGTLPFHGMRVADFTTFWAGPFVTHILGMFGADVIHVESTARPDGTRLMNHHPWTEPQWWERSSCFHSTNTNKRGITLDMNSAEGRKLALKLVSECDVIVENYSPRVMDSWGLSWDEVRAARPDAVMVRMPAFDLHGPLRNKVGFAMTMEQVSGLAWLHGFPEYPPTCLLGPCDPNAGLHGLVGLLIALEHRRRTGEGRLVESRMVSSALNVAGEQVIEYSAYGVRLDRDGNRGPAGAPQNCYQASDWDEDLEQRRWVSLAVATDEQWRALVGVVGEPGWAGKRDLDTRQGRLEHHDELDRVLTAWFSTRTSDDIVDQLWHVGVPVAKVVHPSATLSMEQLAHRKFFENVTHPVHGDSLHPTFPFRLPDWSGPVHRRTPPMLGEHNDEVLGGLLGLIDEELEALRETGVIGTEVKM